MDLHQQSKPPSDGPTPKGALGGTYGLDQVFDFFNGIFSSSAGNTSQNTNTRVGLNGLFGSQQGIPPPPTHVPVTSSSGTSRDKGPVIGNPSSPTLQPKAHSPGSPPPVEGERCHSRDNIGAAREPLSLSSRQGYETPHGNEIEASQEEPSLSQRHVDRRGQPYEVCQDDLLDQHVAYYLRHHPDIHAQHSIYRKRAGTYMLDRREVQVEWQYADDPGGQGFLVIVDGPLRQPFADYMEMTEKNAEYDSKSCNRSSLYSIPKEQRMSFHDQHKVYTRLEAMKVAKEQAAFREKHADYVKDGVEVPDDLMMKYKKTIQQKLGQQAPNRSDHGSKSPPRDLTHSQYVITPPPEQFSEEQGVRGGHTPQHVFASEPMDYFSASAAFGGGNSMWSNVWGSTGPPPPRNSSGLSTAHNYGGGDRQAAMITPPMPPSWQQGSSGNRSTPWSGYS